MRRWLPRTLLVFALGVAAYRVAGQLGGALRSIAAADAGRLALAAAFEVMSYVFIGNVLRRLARDQGRGVSRALLFFAYAVGMVGLFVPLLPAGLGFLETAVPALLHQAHVPIAAALAGVLAYRALATLLPAFVGAGALGHARLFPRGHRRSAAPALQAPDG